MVHEPGKSLDIFYRFMQIDFQGVFPRSEPSGAWDLQALHR